MLNIDGFPPRIEHGSFVSGQDHDRINLHYSQSYAFPLDRFLEVKFWHTDLLRPVDRNGHTLRQYSQFLHRLAEQGSSKQPALLSEEASLIWALFKLCQEPTATTGSTPWEQDSEEAQQRKVAIHRLIVFEALLTGEYLSSNPFSPPDKTLLNSGITSQLKQRELEFWFCIGRVVSTQETDASSARQLDDSLARCRTLLNNFECRDVIYSIAIVRHVGRRWGGVMKPGPGVTDAKRAYDIATDFIRKETVQGTNPVFQRVCSMAMKIWM